MTEERKNTVGYTDSRDYRCLEDLQEIRGSVHLVQLDYCGRERCAPGYAFGPYIRENYVLHVILEGRGRLTVGDRTFAISGGQAFLLSPGEEAVYQADREDPWVYAWIGFHGAHSRKIVESMGFSGQEHVIRVRDAHALGQYIEQMMDHSELTYANSLKRNAYLGLLFSEIIEYADVPEQEERFSEDLYVNMAVEKIISNYNHPVRIAKIASQIGINRSYLTIIFKKQMGISPQQFLIGYRMEKAAEMLIETDTPIRTIAENVGYPDPLTFTKAFKLKYGVNPSSYRNNPPTLEAVNAKGLYSGKYSL